MGDILTGSAGKATGVTTDIRKPAPPRTLPPSSPRYRRTGPTDARATRRTQTR